MQKPRALYPASVWLGVAAAAAACGTDVSLGAAGGCPGGETRCGESCVVLGADPQNCGGCGQVCPSGKCSGGVCEECFGDSCDCPGLVCDGTCVDPLSDPSHCGGCFAACAGTAQYCVQGVCQASCPSPLQTCGDLCVDVLYDSEHCGQCFLPCPPGGYCDFGTCVQPCSFEEAYCDGICVDIQFNPEHCGGCDVVCAPDQVCSDFYCQCSGAVCGLCNVMDLGPMAPQSVVGSTFGEPDDASGSCGGMAGADAAFWFTAATTAVHRFDTAGSSFDTALYAIDPGTCFELTCSVGSPGAELHLPLSAGQAVVVVVDALGAEQGDYMLTVEEAPDCPAMDLGSTVPQVVTGSTVGGTDYLEGSCAFTFSPEATWLFTAPATASYTFDTLGSSYDTVLFVLDGGCGSFELACSDDYSMVSSLVSVMLFEGQQVAVVVDGFGAGDYVLNVQSP